MPSSIAPPQDQVRTLSAPAALRVALAIGGALSVVCAGAAPLSARISPVAQAVRSIRPANPALVLTIGTASQPRERTLHTDFTDPRYWYVGYATRIKRLDQSVSPAAVGFAAGAWADRQTLSYA